MTWAARLAATEDALLWLVEPERKQLYHLCGTGLVVFAASAGRSLHSGEGLAGQAWQTGAPLAVTDYQGWPGRLREAGSQHELQAALCLPLRWDGEVIGVLGVATSRPGQSLPHPPEIEQLGGFADLAAAALDNTGRLGAARRELAEQARIEQRLRRSQARYREMFQQLPAIVYLEVHALGGSWVYESPRVEELFGYTPEEAGRPGFWKTVLHPDDRERVLAEDARCERTGDPWRMEYRRSRQGWPGGSRSHDHAVLVRGEHGEADLFWHWMPWSTSADEELTQQSDAAALGAGASGLGSERERVEALLRERGKTREDAKQQAAPRGAPGAGRHKRDSCCLRPPCRMQLVPRLPVLVGITLTLRRFRSRLAEEGVEPICLTGSSGAPTSSGFAEWPAGHRWAAEPGHRDAQAALHRFGRAHAGRPSAEQSRAGERSGTAFEVAVESSSSGGPGPGGANCGEPARQRRPAHHAGHAGLDQDQPPRPGRADHGRGCRRRHPTPAAGGPVRAVPPGTRSIPATPPASASG